MKNYHLIISTPEGNVFDGDAAMLTVRGSEGDLAILAGHVPFITAVKECEGSIVFSDNTERQAKIGGGILTVSNNVTTLLTSSFNFKDQ
ncbi:MAG: F0F1 ATP synthase subunit epsilon [Clostridia bacterium]|nr:F0F1 ATP synthase subunit epsilon [Clostridia bacterium]